MVFNDTIKVDLNKPLARSRAMLASGDNMANCFGASIYMDGEAVALTGYTVKGYFVCTDGNTIPISGTKSGNTACVTLPRACYAASGGGTLAIKVSGTAFNATVRVIDCYTRMVETDSVNDTEAVVPSLSELLAKIADMEAATEEAREATATVTELIEEIEERFAGIEEACDYAISNINSLQKDKAPIITDSMAGVVCVTSHAAEGIPLHELRLFGRTTQGAVPSPATPISLVSPGLKEQSIAVTLAGKNLANVVDYTYSVNILVDLVDGDSISYRVHTTSAKAWQGMMGKQMLLLHKGVTYTFSFTVDAIASGTISGGLRLWSNNVFIKRATATGTGRWSFTYTPTEDLLAYWSLLVTDSTDENGDATFSAVQLEVGSAATGYAEYRVSTISVPTPNGLPGLPVTSGGNYTDEDGQQWLCDEIDCARALYIQRVKTVTLDGNVGMARETTSTGLNQFYRKVADAKASEYAAMCNYVPYSRGTGANICYKSPDNYFVLRFPEDYQSTTEEEFKAMRAEVPLVFSYALAEPVETYIDESVIYAVEDATLHTTDTTLYNSAGAWMTAEYPADTKLYIDDKFAQLQAAILSQGANV